LIAAVLEIKRRNPRFGCPRIAQQIAFTFGVEINKDVVPRILAQYYRPESGQRGLSWLTVIGKVKISSGVSTCFAASRSCSRVIGSWS